MLKPDALRQSPVLVEKNFRLSHQSLSISADFEEKTIWVCTRGKWAPKCKTSADEGCPGCRLWVHVS